MKLLNQLISISRSLIAKHRLGIKYKSKEIKINLLKIQIYKNDELSKRLS